jgi:hypothetical protein
MFVPAIGCSLLTAFSRRYRLRREIQSFTLAMVVQETDVTRWEGKPMRWLAGSLIVVLISGCGSSDSTTKPSAPGTSPASELAREPAKAKAAGEQAAVNEEFADLVGRITLSGEIPPPRKLSINKDVEVCGAADTVQDVTGKDGGVADVVVEIKGVEQSSDWDWQVPEEGFVIRQKDCQFTP